MKEKLRALRIECGITQKELAEKIRSTSKNIWAYENGIATPPIEVVRSYADFFGVSTDYLLGRSDDLGYVTVKNSPTAPALADDQKQLLDLYARMTHQQKIRAIAYCEGLLSTSANVYSSRK